MKKKAVILGISLPLIVAVIALLGWIGYTKSMAVKSINYDKNLTIFQGGGGNSIILTSEDGKQAIVVDTKIGPAAKILLNAIKAPEVAVVNTHVHADHTGGNSLFPKATLIASAYSQDQWKALAGKNRYPDKTIQSGEEIILDIGSEKVHLRNLGQAHSWDDVIVYLENRKFLMTGDIVFNNHHPAMFTQGGANAGVWINAIDSLINRYGDAKTVLPGHGVLSDIKSLSEMKEYFISIRDALGNAEKLKALKEKYKGYAGIPGMTSFNTTVKFLENEKKNK